MRPKLAILTALIALFARSAAVSSMPTLDQTANSITITSGQQKLIVNLDDASLRVETPCGSSDLIAAIDSPAGAVRPLRAQVPPKVHRGKDSVAALLTFPVPGERKLTLHVDAFPGIEAVFAKSSLTGSCDGRGDSCRWVWSRKADKCFVGGTDGPPVEANIASENARFVQDGWTFLGGADGGLAVLTSGAVGCAECEFFVNSVPSSRFLRPGETLDVGFGVACVENAMEAETLWKLVRDRSLAPLQLPAPAKIEYGKPAPGWLRQADAILDCSGDFDDAAVGKLVSGTVIVAESLTQSAVAETRDRGVRVLARIDCRALTKQTEGEFDRSRDWICCDSEGNPRRSPTSESALVTCFHRPDLRQAVLVQVCDLMNLGVDGIFLDCATPMPECHAPKFEKHSHSDPDRTNNDEFEGLQREIYMLVKTFGEERAVVQNSGVQSVRWPYCDSQMGRVLGEDSLDSQHFAVEQTDAVRAGKAISALRRP